MSPRQVMTKVLRVRTLFGTFDGVTPRAALSLHGVNAPTTIGTPR